jgi:hypothetical protein
MRQVRIHLFCSDEVGGGTGIRAGYVGTIQQEEKKHFD